MHRNTRLGWTGLMVAAICLVGPAKPATAAPSTPRTIDITVTDEGYKPARLEVKAAETVRLAFHSETDSECQGTVKSEELGIKPTRLPKGETTVIEITPKNTGEYSFGCAMGMIRGTVIAKAP